ncbi:MAG: hypothetical protein JWM93_2729 [Frankiales bacterium]|nr:hypothetical protein [Frankiales bacterium]
MDILESGMDRPERAPSRRRSSALVALALVGGGGAVWLHRPGAPDAPPAPVAMTATPTPTPTPTPPAPSPTATVYPFHPTPVSVRTLSCTQFLDQVEVMKNGQWGMRLVSDERGKRSRVTTYVGGGGTARVVARCGPTVWGGAVRQPAGDGNEDYIDLGARRNENGGPRPSVGIFRADNADAWYQITAGGSEGRLGEDATLPHLMAAITHVSLINWTPPGRAGSY